MSRSLEVPRRRSRADRSRLWKTLAVLAAMAVVGGWAAWYVTSPEDLPVSERVLTAAAVAGQPIYVGMFTAPPDFDRSIRVDDVEVSADGGPGLEVTPLLCRGGSISITTSPDEFCAQLVDPAAEDLAAGDSVLVEVRADEPGEVTLDRLRISFRDALSWGTTEAGIAGAVVTVTERPIPAPDDEGDTDGSGAPADGRDGRDRAPGTPRGTGDPEEQPGTEQPGPTAGSAA